MTSHPTRSWQVLESNGQGGAEWRRLLDSWPDPEVFAHPDYLDLYRGPGDRPCCLVYRSAAGTVHYPVILRDLRATEFWTGEPAYDVGPPPFGYAGPFVAGHLDEQARQTLVAEFYDRYRAWAAQQGVVAEYTLFSPFADPPASYAGELRVRIPVVVRTLIETEDAIWSSYRSQVRRNVRAAVRNGVTVTVDHDGKYAAEFLDVHLQTMNRRSVVGSHRLDPGFLDTLNRTLLGRYVYVHAWHDDRIVSSDLLLVSAASVFYFRGGTLADKLDTRANQMLKHEAILWAKREGKRAFLLGGGVQGEDALFRYKAGFAPHGVRQLWCGRWVVEPQRYEQLLRARRECDGGPSGGAAHGAAVVGSAVDGAAVNGAAAAGFFPAYRAPAC